MSYYLTKSIYLFILRSLYFPSVVRWWIVYFGSPPCIYISFVALSLPHRTSFYIPSLSHYYPSITRNKGTSSNINESAIILNVLLFFLYTSLPLVTHSCRPVTNFTNKSSASQLNFN
ncbi:hypothetical protein BDV41DRAFT_99938 [Aspergillus transmontanensis]|uniref:Uncharacterized protein n=1 Tax=Aspergillus transmontanensis TaxID=1034304 RepID=A0A5N6VEG1_9EURO|nr:hypothetical protein BDV41DRAFT_99938 [Aspergillus transmontanensis]